MRTLKGPGQWGCSSGVMTWQPLHPPTEASLEDAACLLGGGEGSGRRSFGAPGWLNKRDLCFPTQTVNSWGRASCVSARPAQGGEGG